MTGKTFTVDFVAKGAASDEWKMVLIESGPWNAQVDDRLRTLQGRLYDCIEAAIDGQLAAKFPESRGKRLVIQVDCYNISRDAVEPFFDDFSSRVFTTGDYKDALNKSPYVASIEFVITFDSIH